ncbi:hypothetical protein AB4Z10_17170 [Bosea sp. RAF48]|uniref:hypothetical protein n=1 Tax=Bosea sp. RAF48 TaxID=3237480 RepID=UPI003F9225AD
MAEKLSPTRRKALNRLSTEPTLLIGTELTAAAWLVMKGLAHRHRLNHFTITPAGSAARAALEPRDER